MPLVAVSPRAGAVGISWSFAHPPAAVWAALTEPVSIGHWLGEVVECDLRPGGSLIVDHGEGYRSRSTVLEADAPRRLAMTWEFPDEPASEVAFTLRASDDGTVLDLAHTGLDELVGSYRVGWITHLTYLEAVTDGVPLPASQFWSLHETLDRGFARRDGD
ncbi:SRPBCC domain-containing protein [Clavibacter sp. Sh2141]|uniref:SRPBCC domain-containing protein n=1 Tax=Clavibacter sp. Sh2141 TaxID=3395374 RepID=UPI0039BCCEB9